MAKFVMMPRQRETPRGAPRAVPSSSSKKKYRSGRYAHITALTLPLVSPQHRYAGVALANMMAPPRRRPAERSRNKQPPPLRPQPFHAAALLLLLLLSRRHRFTQVTVR